MSRLDQSVAGGPRRRFSPRRLAEQTATALIVAGIAMMVQPIWLDLFSYSFVVTLAGTALFIVGSKLPE
jgi:hypothetical protein